jgi:hypothetical protein
MKAVAAMAVIFILFLSACTSADSDSETDGEPLQQASTTVATSNSIRGPEESDAALGQPSALTVTLGARVATGPGLDWIALANTSDIPMDVSGWVVKSKFRETGFTVPGGTVVEPSRSIIIYETMTVGQKCQPDTAVALFTCNALGLDRTTLDVLFPGYDVEVFNTSGVVVAASGE